MNVSLRWLEAFLRRQLDARDVAERLTMLGAPVDAVEPLHADLGELVVGLVERCGSIRTPTGSGVCLVNDGTAERLQRRVRRAERHGRQAKYPFAPVGATSSGKGGAPMRSSSAKLRGEVSEGMLCSARELGLGQEHDGILELDTDAAPGTPLLEAVPLADHRLVVDVAPEPSRSARPQGRRPRAGRRRTACRSGCPSIPGTESLDVPPARRRGGDRGKVGGVAHRHRGHRGLSPLPARP